MPFLAQNDLQFFRPTRAPPQSESIWPGIVCDIRSDIHSGTQLAYILTCVPTYILKLSMALCLTYIPVIICSAILPHIPFDVLYGSLSDIYSGDLVDITSDMLYGILPSNWIAMHSDIQHVIIYGYLAYVLAMYLAYILTCCLAFCPTYVLAIYLTYFLTFY